MEIRIEPHTSDRLAERGTTTAEVEDVIRTGVLAQAHSGRFAKAKVYKYDGTWRGRFYRQKKVRVVFAMDRNTAVTVTVVVSFGFWGQPA